MLPKETNENSPHFEGLDLLKRLWKQHLLYLDSSSKLENHLDINEAECAIILSANDENYERFLKLELFTQILKKFHLRADIFSIQLAQLQILNTLKLGFFEKDQLLRALKLLKSIADTECVSAFLEHFKCEVQDKKQGFFTESKELESLCNELLSLSDTPNLNQRLSNALMRFKNTEFNIVVAGIMNAGKSSLLNALLKTRILGVSNIPETANLTLLKYAQEPKARLYFWNKAEFESLQKNALYDKGLAEVLNELKPQIKEFISDESLSKDIKLNELSFYSSAKNPLSVLIQKIELFSELDFLKDNITIIDTPGLDDVFVQREQLSKDYLNNCDFLMYLMNASQSLSQKDSEFLLACLNNSRISRFLIIISKADLLTQDELDEVIIYTQKSLKQRLKEQGLDEFLLEKIDFLSISSKQALEFYENKADENTLMQSQIPRLETYLYQQIFSSTKSKLVLESFKNELKLITNELIEKLERENKALQSKNLGLNDENVKLLSEFKTEAKKLESLKAELKECKAELKANNLNANPSLKALFKRLENKLNDEFSYAKANSRALEALEKIFLQNLEDGFNDILRQIYFQNLKITEAFNEKLSLKYKAKNTEFLNDIQAFRKLASTAFTQFLALELLRNVSREFLNLIMLKNEAKDFKTKLSSLFEDFLQAFDCAEFVRNLSLENEMFSFLQDKVNELVLARKEKELEFKQRLEKLDTENLSLILEQNEAKKAKLIHIKESLNHAH